MRPYATHFTYVFVAVLAILALRTLFGQQPPAALAPLPVNRYVLIDRRVDGSQLFILLDNATGHCWERQYITSQTPPHWEWRDIGCPPQNYFPERLPPVE